MIKAALDLHVHSCLSPCAGDDMTPNNIVNMAKLKGLDIISVCDHNHTGNLHAISKAAGEHGLILLPGIELETSEEIHILCYFPSLACAEHMQDILNLNYKNIRNREDIFGTQWIFDAGDNPVKKIDHLLCTSTNLDLYQAVSLVRRLGGIIVPAHVDRESYSILSSLGAIPEDLELKTLELSVNTNREDFLKNHPEYGDCFFIYSSDAHELGRILEKNFIIELDELCICSLMKKLKGNSY